MENTPRKDNSSAGSRPDYLTGDGRFLKNPLPVPKRRAHVRMEFDLTDDWDYPDDQDRFDIEIADDDDFDI